MTLNVVLNPACFPYRVGLFTLLFGEDYVLETLLKKNTLSGPSAPPLALTSLERFWLGVKQTVSLLQSSLNDKIFHIPVWAT